MIHSNMPNLYTDIKVGVTSFHTAKDEGLNFEVWLKSMCRPRSLDLKLIQTTCMMESITSKTCVNWAYYLVSMS